MKELCTEVLSYYNYKTPCCSSDINECNFTNGGCEHSCTNTLGSFNCSCDRGYQLDEKDGLNCTGKRIFDLATMEALSIFLFCSDVNECEIDVLHNCHGDAQCTNTEGSYICSCSPGYTGDGKHCTGRDLWVACSGCEHLSHCLLFVSNPCTSCFIER